VEIASEQAASAYLIVRPTVKLEASGEEALSRLRSHEVDRRTVSEWPGTRLRFGGSATLFEYKMNAGLVASLISIASGLYDWLQPKLPEDLGFLRADRTTWLASISHEHDAYIELSATEFERLDELPELKGLIGHGPSS
jgi:hypothetical protein